MAQAATVSHTSTATKFNTEKLTHSDVCYYLLNLYEVLNSTWHDFHTIKGITRVRKYIDTIALYINYLKPIIHDLYHYTLYQLAIKEVRIEDLIDQGVPPDQAQLLSPLLEQYTRQKVADINAGTDYNQAKVLIIFSLIKKWILEDIYNQDATDHPEEKIKATLDSIHDQIKKNIAWCPMNSAGESPTDKLIGHMNEYLLGCGYLKRDKYNKYNIVISEETSETTYYRQLVAHRINPKNKSLMKYLTEKLKQNAESLSNQLKTAHTPPRSAFALVPASSIPRRTAADAKTHESSDRGDTGSEVPTAEARTSVEHGDISVRSKSAPKRARTTRANPSAGDTHLGLRHQRPTERRMENESSSVKLSETKESARTLDPGTSVYFGKTTHDQPVKSKLPPQKPANARPNDLRLFSQGLTKSGSGSRHDDLRTSYIAKASGGVDHHTQTHGVHTHASANGSDRGAKDFTSTQHKEDYPQSQHRQGAQGRGLGLVKTDKTYRVTMTSLGSGDSSDLLRLRLKIHDVDSLDRQQLKTLLNPTDANKNVFLNESLFPIETNKLVFLYIYAIIGQYGCSMLDAVNHVSSGAFLPDYSNPTGIYAEDHALLRLLLHNAIISLKEHKPTTQETVLLNADFKALKEAIKPEADRKLSNNAKDRNLYITLMEELNTIQEAHKDYHSKIQAEAYQEEFTREAYLRQDSGEPRNYLESEELSATDQRVIEEEEGLAKACGREQEKAYQTQKEAYRRTQQEGYCRTKEAEALRSSLAEESHRTRQTSVLDREIEGSLRHQEELVKSLRLQENRAAIASLREQAEAADLRKELVEAFIRELAETRSAEEEAPLALTASSFDNEQVGPPLALIESSFDNRQGRTASAQGRITYRAQERAANEALAQSNLNVTTLYSEHHKPPLTKPDEQNGTGGRIQETESSTGASR